MQPDLLNLAGYRLVSVESSEHDYHIKAEATATPEACIHCQSHSLVGFGRREQMVRDLPSHGRRVGLYINTRRFQCKGCGKTFYEPLPEIDEKRLMTSRLASWMGKQSIKRTFASIADEVGCTEYTVRAVFNDFINQLQATVRFETPKWMGIDEIHLINPRGVISNIENNTIVELLPNRNKETIIKYLSALDGKSAIQYVAMDMWQPYRDAVKLVLPQAKVTIDKFHVVKMANESMERIRKSFRESLTPKARRGLMHDRFVLLKREHALSDQEALTLFGWISNYPDLGTAYRLKEEFFKIYDHKTRNDALAAFAAWDASVTPDVRWAFQDLIRAWRNWQPYILNYFDHPVTNAYTESLNNLIRVMNRLGRGYSFEALRAKILFAEGAFKKQIIKPKFTRRRDEDVCLGMASFELLTAHQHDEREKVLNYGPEISTLARMIDEGLI